MKKFLLATVLVPLMFSCGNSGEVDKLNSTNDSLKNVVANKDSVLNVAFTDINDIANTLSLIAEREKIVAVQTSGEITKTTKEQISDNINAISDLLLKNKNALNNLKATTKRLKDANMKIEALNDLVASLQAQIEGKNIEIAELSRKLESLNIEVANLSKTVGELQLDKKELQEDVATKTEEINTVYYIVGVEKELIKKEIVNKEGFIGRTAVVGNNRNLENFTKADLRNLERIPVGGRKAKLVTSHPKDSYLEVVGAKGVIEEIVITDKKAFWRDSKILIVSYK